MAAHCEEDAGSQGGARLAAVREVAGRGLELVLVVVRIE